MPASSACCRSSPSRTQFADTGGADASAFTVAGQALVAFHDWTFLLGPGFCAGIGIGLILGFIMYTSGLLPRRLAVLGLVGGSLAFVATTGAPFGVYEPKPTPQFLLTVPEIIWEATFGIYLVRKASRPPSGERPSEHRTRRRQQSRRADQNPRPGTGTPPVPGSPRIAANPPQSRPAVGSEVPAKRL